MAFVGPYDLLELIGEGAMGRVFAARDRRTGEMVAVKALSSEARPVDLFSIKREFRLAQALSSPHLVPIYDLFAEGLTSYVAMPLLRGLALDRWADETPWRSRPALLCDVLVGALSGLADMHRAGLVHRDIKPPNIMVEPSGRVVLLDYGLATRSAACEPFVDSDPRLLTGTLAYLPPEALLGEGPTPAQDLFALGVSVFEVVTGGPPPRRPLTWQVSPERARGELVASWPDIPAGLVAFVTTALQGDPAARGSADGGRALVDPLRAVGRQRGGTGGAVPALVGRAPELEALARAIRAGGARAAVLGASGIGKTALTAAALSEVRRDGRDHLVLAGRSHPGEQVPYRVFDAVIDELSRWLVRCAATIRRSVVPADFGILQATFPVLRRVSIPGLELAPIPADPIERRARLGPALAALFQGLSASWPIVLWLDDVHWADQDGSELLHELVALLGQGGVNVIVSGRELPDRLRGMFSLEIDLRPLRDEDARQLAASRAEPHELADDALALPLSVASGNPALLCYLVDSLSVDGRACASLAEVIALRLRDLPAEAATLVRALALLGQPIPLEAVAALVDSPEPRRILHAIERVGLTSRTPIAGDEALEVAHDCLARAIRDSLPPDEVPDLHRRLASALEPVDEVAREVVAEQWDRAGDASKARSLYLAAGQSAAEALAFEHAVRCLSRALSLSRSDERAQPLLALSRAFSLAGRTGEAARGFEECAALVDSDRPALLEQAATHYLIAGDVEAGLELVHQLFAASGLRLPRRPAAVIARVLYQRVRSRWRGAQMARGPARSDPGDIRSHARIADLAFAASTSLAHMDVALGAYLHGLHLHHGLRAGDPVRAARALALEAGFGLLAGRDETAARQLLARAVAEAGAASDPRLRALFAIVSCASAWITGRWAACVEAGREAERIAEEECVGAWWELNFVRSMLQDALRWSGRYRKLGSLTGAYLDDARRRGDRYASVTFRTRFACTLALVDDRSDDAWAECQAGATWSARGVHLQHLAELHARAECLLYDGRPSEALELVSERMRRIRRAPILTALPPRAKLLHLRAACRLAVAAGCDGSARDELLAEARRDVLLVRETDWGYTRLLADLVSATADRMQGREVRLDALQRRAHELDMPQYAAAIGLIGGDVEQIHALRDLGVRDPRRWVAVLVPGEAIL